MHLVIGTPCYGGMMCTEYTQSLLALKEACMQHNIQLTCIFLGNESLIQRGLLERIPHSVTGQPLYRTTVEGQAALRAPVPPKPVRIGPKIRMLEPRIKAMDTRSVKPRR